MNFESPDVEKEFPGLYASQGLDEDLSDEEAERSTKKRDSKSREKKRDRKDKGYRMFEEEDSEEEPFIDDTRSPSKMKKHSKPSFKFAKKDKFYKPKDKEKDIQKEKEKEEKKKEDKESKKDKLKFKKKKDEGSKTDLTDGAKVKEVKPAFGVPLVAAVERSRCHDGVQLPAVFRECIDYVEEFGLSCEGIYRISGVKSKVQALKDAYNRGLPVYLHEHEPPIVASLLKQFLRDLPEPVLTPELMPKFEQASTVKNVKQKVEQFQELIEQLPTPNRLLLSWMIVHMTHVIAKESHNKMSLQNVSIVLSPTMRISHRVLNVFFTYSKILFRDTVLKRYVPPLRPVSSRWSLELPESPTAIEEELHKQESLLNQLHEDVRKVKNAADKEEQLWEVQRVVTQLKRKLKHVRKAQEAAKAAERREVELAQEKLKEQPNEEKKEKEEQQQDSQQTEVVADTEVQQSQPETVEAVEEQAGVKVEVEEEEEAAQSPAGSKEAEESTQDTLATAVAEEASEAQPQPLQQAAEQQSQPQHPLPLQQAVLEEEAQVHQLQDVPQVPPVVAAVAVAPAEVVAEVTVHPQPQPHPTVPTTVPQQYAPQQQQPHQPVPQVVEQLPAPSHHPQPAEPVTQNIATVPTEPATNRLAPMPAAIPKLQSPLQPMRLHDGAKEQEQKPGTIQEEPVTFEVGGEAFHHEAQEEGWEPDERTVAQSLSDMSLEERQEKVQITTIEIVDRKGLPTVETTEEAMLDNGDKSDAESSSSSVVSSPDEETDDEEMQELLLEETTLTLEEEELRAIGDELLQKIETERSEIERLHQEIAELQEIRDDLYEEEDSDSDSSSSSEDEDELQETLKSLIKENKELEVQNSDLCDKVHLERQICLEVKVQIRLIQLRQTETAGPAHVERELMIF